MQKQKSKNKKTGFTLIEMLVVVGIIGLLSTLLLISVSGIRKNSIDTRRKANLENVRGAINMYYSVKNSWPVHNNNWPTLINLLTSEGFLTDNVPPDEDGDGVNDYGVVTCQTGLPGCTSGAQMRLCTVCVVTGGEGCTISGNRYCLAVQ